MFNSPTPKEQSAKKKESESSSAETTVNGEPSLSTPASANNTTSSQNCCCAGGCSGKCLSRTVHIPALMDKDLSLEPVQDIRPPRWYEFEIPHHLVGLVIGVKGRTLKELTTRTNALVRILPHPDSNRATTHQICHIEGEREIINNCIRVLRRRFPKERFPDLNLHPFVVKPPNWNVGTNMQTESVTWLPISSLYKTPVEIICTINLAHFFIQQKEHPSFASLGLLDNYMTKLYEESPNIPEVPIPSEKGLLCAAPMPPDEDNNRKWQRAVVVTYYKESDEAFVKYVDHGGYKTYARSALRMLRNDLTNYPFQSNEVMLAHVRPIDGTSTWCSAAENKYSELCLSKKVMCKLVGSDAATLVPMIELYVTMNTPSGMQYEECFNQYLLKKRLAGVADPSKMIALVGERIH